MGSGASKNISTKSKQENLGQSLSTQNRTNVTRSELPSSKLLANSSKRSFKQIQEQNQIPSIHNSGTSLPYIPSSSAANARKIKTLANGTEPPASSYQQGYNNDDHNEEQLVPINNSQERSRSTSAMFLPPVNQLLTDSNTPSKRLTSVDKKPFTLLAGQTGHCSFCPHCQRLSQINIDKSTSPQPVWITEAPRKDHQHIIMDHYDEEAVRAKTILERGRLPGIYDYLPNLTIEEKKDYNQISSKYSTLPIVVKPGTPISPACTPFPNYNVLQRREQRLNKPYTSTLFTD